MARDYEKIRRERFLDEVGATRESIGLEARKYNPLSKDYVGFISKRDREVFSPISVWDVLGVRVGLYLDIIVEEFKNFYNPSRISSSKEE